MSANTKSDLHFSFSFADLVDTSIAKEGFLTRDQADLNDRGITVARITGLKALRDAFIAIPSETTQVSNQSKTTEARDKKADELRIQMTDIYGIAKTTFGAKSAEYKSFNIKKLSSYTASELYIASETMITLCGTYNVSMSAKGLKPAMVTNLTTLRNALLPLMEATPLAIGDTGATTVKRHNAANALFDEMKAMCEIGSNYYQNRDALKAKDYVIYDTDPNVVLRQGTLKAKKVFAPKAVSYDADSRFQIKVKSGTSIIAYFSILKKGTPGAKSATVLYNPNIFETFTAADLGFDETKGIIFFNIYNPNNDSAEYIIKIG